MPGYFAGCRAIINLLGNDMEASGFHLASIYSKLQLPAWYGAGGLKPGSRLILGFFKAKRTVVGVTCSLGA